MNDFHGGPAAIEQELAATRTRLGTHLEELSRRLSPGQLVDEGLAYLREGQASAFMHNLGADVRDNPLPVAVAGLGLAWLAIVGSRARNGAGSSSRALVPYDEDSVAERARLTGDAVTRAADETEDAFRARVAEARARVLGLQRDASEAVSAFADRVQQAMDNAQQVARDSMDRMRQSAAAIGDLAQRGGDMAARAGNSIAETVGENPLLLGALGITAGVLLGALLPRTQQEEALTAPAASWAAHKANEAADEVVARGTRAADAAAAAAYEAAQR